VVHTYGQVATRKSFHHYISQVLSLPRLSAVLQSKDVTDQHGSASHDVTGPWRDLVSECTISFSANKHHMQMLMPSFTCQWQHATRLPSLAS